MSDQFDVHSGQFNVGVISAVGSAIGFYVPKAGGVITLTNMGLLGYAAAAGTINGLKVVEWSVTTAGVLTLTGTLGTAPAATSIPALGTVIPMTLTQAYVQPGTVDKMVGLAWTSGTVTTDLYMTYAYIMGR